MTYSSNLTFYEAIKAEFGIFASAITNSVYYYGNNICQNRHSGESRNPELAWMPDRGPA